MYMYNHVWYVRVFIMIITPVNHKFLFFVWRTGVSETSGWLRKQTIQHEYFIVSDISPETLFIPEIIVWVVCPSV